MKDVSVFMETAMKTKQNKKRSVSVIDDGDIWYVT